LDGAAATISCAAHGRAMALTAPAIINALNLNPNTAPLRLIKD
jgi:hypothetical protein